MDSLLTVRRLILKLFKGVVTEKDNLEEILGAPLLAKIAIDEVEEIVLTNKINSTSCVTEKSKYVSS